MEWLARSLPLRENPSGLLRDCRAVVSMAYPYPRHKPATPDGFTVSRFSQPTQEDYHKRVGRLCRELATTIEDLFPGSKSRVCVDSAPILERSFAHAAGTGFFGKNNMLIIPNYGSYFFLAEILTTAPLRATPAEPMENLCGACRLCIEACPTGALEGPFELDAAKCLSYLTVEYRAAVGHHLGEKMGDCFMGCDRCQEICPFNTEEAERVRALPATNEFLGMTEGEFKKIYGRTALARAGLEKIKDNIRAIKGSA
jgi:epoxyqueuosine reductase